MSNQAEAARESMIQWLSHEQELGKAPSKIEPAGTFQLHDMTYHMFKYKKGVLGKWLLGVCGGYETAESTEHCGHVFSEMEEYDPSTAEEKSIGLVETVRQFFMNEAAKYEAADPDASEGNSKASPQGISQHIGEEARSGYFTSFVLLSSTDWDSAAITEEMLARGFTEPPQEENSKETSSDSSSDDDSSLFFHLGDMMIVISCMPAPVPGKEAEKNAATNYFWPDAVAVTETHQAHAIVAVLGKDTSALENAKALVHANCACLKLENAIGVYTAGTVFEPSFYLNSAKALDDDSTPILNLVYFGLYNNQGNMCGYTYGLDSLGKDEIEVLDCDATPEELHSFLYSIADYVVTCDVTLRDGETIGFSAEEKLPITKSKSVALGDMMTLKIGWRPAK